MYETTPKRTNKAASYTSTILFITAFAAMMFSGISWVPYPSIMQLAAIVALGFAIMLLIRYTLTSYIYSIIITDDGKYDLTVTEARRKSRITVCRVSLSGIEKTEIINAENKKELKAQIEGRKVFNYCIDLAPAKFLCIFGEECGEKYAIKLSCDDGLEDIISRYSSCEGETK